MSLCSLKKGRKTSSITHVVTQVLVMGCTCSPDSEYRHKNSRCI